MQGKHRNGMHMYYKVQHCRYTYLSNTHAHNQKCKRLQINGIFVLNHSSAHDLQQAEVQQIMKKFMCKNGMIRTAKNSTETSL